MQKIIIKNLGPIQEATISLKPFMVLIGKSSSGKSVLLRTISLLKWLYKQEQIKSFHEAKLFNNINQKEFMNYLKESMLDIYINHNTEIALVDDKPLIEIKGKNITLYQEHIKTEQLIGKIVFINDVRNFLPELLAIPRQREIKASYHTNDMIANFIESINEVKYFKLKTMENTTLTAENEAGFIKYYLIHNDIKIPFEQSSSGEKSTSIMETISSYFAHLYDIKKKSLDKIAIENIIFDLKKSISTKGRFTENNVIKRIKLIETLLSEKNKPTLDIFIEEPESNLFPINQMNMAYYLASLRNAKNKPNIMFSTHSPYILTSLNNILYASMVEQKLQDNKKDDIYKIIDKKNIIDYKDLVAYKLENGKAKSIIDKETKLIDAEYIDTISGEIMDDFYKIAELDND
ncbi:AAA family ATPase [Campylobacter coli]|uniref:AAA family ATPase n=1 Tax=Campylobacter coli TaxID=195 RepID=UPI000930E68F|nr:AAA family ATPase [Campylobacter coli]EGA8550628.1 ATP-binding protein [Campylobacter coli]HED6221099.1 ATP-binding protein [Campylobacter coli]HED6275060.1 ATP-binding protein [Campylobacter coli]HEG6479704.1 ATP-binding protein [Campylobacter coli]HEG8278283.1 ATP-binding protein [Campylobacter coli]